jgi:hypothetical protein
VVALLMRFFLKICLHSISLYLILSPTPQPVLSFVSMHLITGVRTPLYLELRSTNATLNVSFTEAVFETLQYN